MFSKSVTSITTDDLQNLLGEEAVENVRLEFKREIPSKNETLKKLSSFANTFGGYLVIGIEEDGKNGIISSIPGVDTESGFKQKIISWCFGGISAPLNVEVSEPIPSPQDVNKFCYVIYVGESDLAPHFINGRKGCYIRTDELSQRFEAKLATQNEFLSMLERRKKIHERKEQILTRAQDRFNAYVDSRYNELGGVKDGIGARFSLSIVPRFPAKPIATQLEVLSTIKQTNINWRQVGFPRLTEGTITQNESAIVLRPASGFSILEFNVWGLMFYASEIQEQEDHYNGIHLYRFLGNVCVFLKHAKLLMDAYNILSDMSIQLQFDGIKKVPWIYGEGNVPYEGPSSLLDDSILIKLDISASDVRERTDGLAMDLLDNILFSMNYSQLVGERDQLRNLLKAAYKFNFWNIPEEFAE